MTHWRNEYCDAVPIREVNVKRVVPVSGGILRTSACIAMSARQRGPWRHLEAVEFAALEWVDWFKHRRLLEGIGYVPPAELEQATISSTGSQPW